MTDRPDGRKGLSSVLGRRPTPRVRALLEFLGVVSGTVLVAATPNPPTNALQWVQMVGGAVLGGGAGISLARTLDKLGKASPRDTGGAAGEGSGAWTLAPSQRSALKAVLALALVVVAVAVAGPPLVSSVRPLTYGVFGCPPATQLRMVAEPETIMTAREVATAYESATATDHHGCPTARVYVFSAPATALAAHLGTADGWSNDPTTLRDVGPQPDLWLAGSDHEVSSLHAAPGSVAESVPVARSPLVLAVPATAERPDGTWSALFRRFTEGGPGVVRPGPQLGEVGLLASALLYDSDRAAVTRREVPWPGLSAPEIERRLEASLEPAKLPAGDVGDVLCRRRTQDPGGEGGPVPAAIVASEQEVARYNAGLPLGGSCGATPPPGEDRQLVALYPVDTGDQDVQLVRMAWNAPAQQAAATAFGAWVRGDAGRAALARTGLRPIGSYPPVALLVAAFGVAPTPPSTEPVAEARVTAAAATYASTRRPSRVLFAFDTSRSMGTLDSGGQRAAVAATAVQSGLGHLGPSDEFGLWLFPGGGGQGHVEAVPLGTLASSGLPAVQEALRNPPLTGGAPLFRAVVDGVSALAATTLRPTTPPTAGVAPPEDPVSKRALIVLTDSQDSGSGLSARDAADQIGRRGVRVIVVTLGDARCARAGLPQLVEETGGDCVDADTATVVGRVAEIVDELGGGA